jgi:hypothetical protein
MRRAILAALACLSMSCALAGPGDSTFPLYMRPGQVGPIGYCQLSVGLSAVKTSTCTGGIPKGASYALICNEGADAARWRDDGPVPTTTVGNIVGAGTATAPVCSAFATNFAALQWIAETSSAILDITFYQ